MTLWYSEESFTTPKASVSESRAVQGGSLQSSSDMKTAEEFYREKERWHIQVCDAIGKPVNWARKNSVIAWELAVECERLDEECCKLVEELRIANEKIGYLERHNY